MVEIMTEYWKGMLVDLPLDPSQSSEQIVLPPLGELKNKILVKVKRVTKAHGNAEAKPTTLQAPAEPGRSNSATSDVSTSTSSSEEVAAATKEPPAPKPKITDALAKLGIYTGGYHFKSFDQPGGSHYDTKLAFA
jgi:hypothetical protein